MISKSRKYIKTTAYILLFDMILSVVFPTFRTMYALTSGPSAPEFSSFEPVATTNLVDPLTGNFTYNLPIIQIPGPDGGGYAMSLSYHSGTSPEEESSWVGHGWTLNPGAINKNVRGFPDEYDNTQVDFYNKTRPNWTMSGSEKLNVEFFSQTGEDKGKGNTSPSPSASGSTTGSTGSNGSGTGSDDGEIFQFGLGISKHVRFNNYQGLAKTVSLSLSTGFGSLSMNRSATGITFSANIDPFSIGKKRKRVIYKGKQKKEKVTKAVEKANKEKEKIARRKANKESLNNVISGAARGTLFGGRSFTDMGQATSLSKLHGYNFNVSFGAQINPVLVPVGLEGGLSGTFSLNFTKPFDQIPTYGYLNTPSGIGNYKSDYFTEKGQPFDRRDYFIGVPFSTPDNYMLTGEGLSGGFRAYRNSIGHYFPEKIDGDVNKIKTFGIGVELMVGTNIGVGVNLAFGNSTSKMRDWKRKGNTNDGEFSFDNNDTHQYRFFGDMGGKIEYGSNDLAKARLTASPNFPGITSIKPNLSSTAIKDLDLTEAKPSSHIIKENDGFSIYNEAGLNYKYTTDINVRNTANLAIDVDENDIIEENYLAYKKLYLDNNFDVDECVQNVVMGDVKKVGYATTSLLKLITTSDYIDIGGNGPDDADFGGWTAFDYHKKYGDANDENNSNWYRWRIPYNGLFYNKNSISDTKDDTGYLSSGEKEVYFLKKVETKTHIAYFVTNKTTPDRFDFTSANPESKYLQGSGVDRFDGLAAAALNATDDPAALDASAKNEIDQLEYLEKVVLFSKARPEIPLQTTNFQYDYSLVSNLPNNINGKFPESTNLSNSGKLTLRKVWSEFEGVISARISSYKFDYRYKDMADYPDYFIDENPNLSDFFSLSDQYSVNAQNPDYGPYLLDAWGNNQYQGNLRHLNLVTWPYQGDIPSNAFDPAAWQLKQITLPSGGQILVQYESKDYSYVQDRDVMSLVKLTDFNDDYDSEDPSYTLDLSDLGYDEIDDADKISELYQQLRSYFLEDAVDPVTNLSNDRRRIYFKFLYALEGNYPGIENCKSEYISGYARVKDVIYDNTTNKISIQLDGTSDGKNLVGVGLFDSPVEDQGYKLTPRQACYDYYVTQRWGKFSAGCESDLERRYEEDVKELAKCDGNLSTNIRDIVDIAGFTIKGMTLVSGLAVNSKYPRKYEVCQTLNPDLSYLKIPINKAKRGGGIRVKRVLMFDKGIESGDAAIYGQQYKYELEDGRSSGVATNEPSEMREENPLVSFLPKKDQSWLSRLIVGKDREQSEGPIGESLLPSPSIKHSRIVVENIHTGKTGSGYTIHEFFTCKDYPFDKLYDYTLEAGTNPERYDIATSEPVNGVEYSSLQDDSYDDKLRIPVPSFSYSLDKAWASQGFRFIVNAMDGKPKSARTYGGDYQSGNKSYISSGQDYYYYEPGERVRMLNSNGVYKWDTPGKEMDITMEKYSIHNQNLDFSFEIDVSVGLTLFPPIFVSGWLQFAYSEQLLNKYAISKVISYPAITKRIVSYSDNIASTTENLGFDYATGRTVLTKTYDAYHDIPLTNSTQVHDGSIYNLNIPAHWNYNEMGRKSENSSYTNQLLASSGQVISYGSGANPINADLTWNIKADKVISAGASTFNTLAGVSTWIDTNIHTIYNSSSAQVELEKIWRLHENFVFKGETQKSSDRDTQLGKIYEGGIIKNFVPFDYAVNSQVEQWVKLNEVTKYSPNGNALEEKDVLGVYSASKYGYNFTQPIMVGQNARYDEIYFEHFEDKLTIEPNLVSGIAHSGSYSQQITTGAVLVKNVVAKELLATTGGWLKFWTKSDAVLDEPSIVIGSDNYTPKIVAKTGEWSLYRVFIEPSSFTLDQSVNISLSFINDNVYVDDIKFNPKESQTTCFVYDLQSLRLVTLFDDQHFGLFYQYNSEGQLVRKLIETEKGLKVITETQYNTPREDRENF